MRRYLVLTDEIRRHPFLAGLPPHARRVGAEDVRQFLMAYCACLLAVATFIF